MKTFRLHPPWRDLEGDRRTKSVVLKRPGPYEIVTGGEPVDESIEISVPSHTGG